MPGLIANPGKVWLVDDIYRPVKNNEFPHVPDCRQCKADNPEYYEGCIKKIFPVHHQCHKDIHGVEKNHFTKLSKKTKIFHWEGIYLMGIKEDITKIYVGYYDRAPDPAGLDYWIGRANGGMTLSEIAASFAVQPESIAKYPYLDNPLVASASAFVTSIYNNLFNRAPDAAGLAYWVAELAADKAVGQRDRKRTRRRCVRPAPRSANGGGENLDLFAGQHIDGARSSGRLSCLWPSHP